MKKLWRAGFALGSSLDNSVALDGDAVLNPEGLRFSDEFVRHKTLDAIGDLSLAGAPIIGCYRAYRPGHTINAMMLSALFADRKAYEIVENSPRKIYAVGAGAIGRAPPPTPRTPTENFRSSARPTSIERRSRGKDATASRTAGRRFLRHHQNPPLAGATNWTASSALDRSFRRFRATIHRFNGPIAQAARGPGGAPTRTEVKSASRLSRRSPRATF